MSPFAHWCAARNYDALPKSSTPEVAFLGRSNVGKSSLLNAVLRAKLAPTSKKPGKTRALQLYRTDRMIIVDMPGYGYAQRSKVERWTWEDAIGAYILRRSALVRAYVLVDIRRGVGPKDEQLLSLLDRAVVATELVFTKVDTLPEQIVHTRAREIVRDVGNNHPIVHPVVHETSARRGKGLEELRRALTQFAGETPPQMKGKTVASTMENKHDAQNMF